SSYLAHVVGAGGAHAVADHFRLLDDLFHSELSDDAAQVAFHHQADETLALLGRLGEKLFGGGLDRFGIRFDLDLRDGFDGYRDTLFRIEVLLGRDVERHQLQREQAAILHHRENHGAAPLDDAGAAETIYHESLMRPGLAVQPGEHGHQQNESQCHQSCDGENNFYAHNFSPP